MTEGINTELIDWLLVKLQPITNDDPNFHQQVVNLISAGCKNILPDHIITQASVYYQECRNTNINTIIDTPVIEDTIVTSIQDPTLQEESENSSILTDEDDSSMDNIGEDISVSDIESTESTEDDLNELLQSTKFQNTYNNITLSAQARKIMDEFPKLEINDVRDIKLVKDIKNKYTDEETYCIWETLEITNNKRNIYSTVLCNQAGLPVDVVLKKGFPGRIGKATLNVNINDYVLHGEINKKYFNFYIFKILNVGYNEEKGIALAQYRLVFKSFNEYSINAWDTFPKVWLFNPKTNEMTNEINDTLVNEVKNGFFISFSNVIQHLVENVTLNNFRSDNDPNFNLSIYGRTFNYYKPKNIYINEWLNATGIGSRIFVYNQLTGPNANNRGVNYLDIFNQLYHVVFDLWIPELRHELNTTYNFYVPIFLDLVVRSLTNNINDINECLECSIDYEHSLCQTRNENPFLDVTMALSTPSDIIIQNILHNKTDKAEMYIPSNIQIRKAGNAGMFCEEFHQLAGTLKAQLFPLGSDSWLGLLKSFGDLNKPYPLFSRFKVR
jgi:hypothetical protein